MLKLEPKELKTVMRTFHPQKKKKKKSDENGLKVVTTVQIRDGNSVPEQFSTRDDFHVAFGDSNSSCGGLIWGDVAPEW